MTKFTRIIFFLLIPVSVSGQFAPLTDHYVLNPLSINPAYAGGRGALNIAAFYRNQWAGMEGAPETMSLSIDAPVFSEKVGLGLIIASDNIGVTKETQYITNYSYKLNVGEGSLSLGLGASINTTNTAWSDLVVVDPGDEFYLIDSRVFVVPNFSFGAYYTVKNYFAGFSIPRFLGYRFDFDKNKYRLANDPDMYTYMLNTGYLFSLAPRIKFFPSTLVSWSKNEHLQYDLNGHFNLYDLFWIGGSYRNGRSVAWLFQLNISNQMKVAYSYDFELGKLGKYTNGSHEVMLRYEFRYKVEAVNPLIF
jgi:type IX secretion system PorP/SprF family membrane protein